MLWRRVAADKSCCFRLEESYPIYEFGMILETFNNFTRFQIPYNDLRIFARACDIPITSTDVYLSDMIEVTMQRGLQS